MPFQSNKARRREFFQVNFRFPVTVRRVLVRPVKHNFAVKHGNTRLGNLLPLIKKRLFGVNRFVARLDDAQNAFEKGWRSVVVIETDDAQGSGVIVRPGIVATNCHVVGNGAAIRVYEARSRRAQTDTPYRAAIYAERRDDDLCLLIVAGLNGAAAKIRRAKTLAVGEKVFAIGAPKGLEYSLSAGVVSQLRGNGNNAPIIQTDAAISPGSSGGGLFDGDGNLVGITTFKRRGAENINFAIPSEWILDAL